MKQHLVTSYIQYTDKAFAFVSDGVRYGCVVEKTVDGWARVWVCPGHSEDCARMLAPFAGDFLALARYIAKAIPAMRRLLVWTY